MEPTPQLGANKAVAVGLGGSLVVVLAWVETIVWPDNPIPAEVAVAISTVLNAGLAYFVPHKFGA